MKGISNTQRTLRVLRQEGEVMKGWEDNIKAIRNEIFKLAKKTENIEMMHWYMWLDDFFENDELHKDDFKDLQWRIWLLRTNGEPINPLTNMITSILEQSGCVNVI